MTQRTEPSDRAIALEIHAFYVKILLGLRAISPAERDDLLESIIERLPADHIAAARDPEFDFKDFTARFTARAHTPFTAKQ